MFIGVDGGGTKTAGVVVDGDGHVLARRTVESTNLNAVGRDVARQRLADLVHLLLVDAGTQPDQVHAIGLGMSGVGRPAEQALVQGWVQSILPGVPCVVENDAVIALAAGTLGDLYGVVVVSGTGMIVFGVDHSGRRRRAGGWGPLLGEQGGGFGMGVAILKAVSDAADGVGPATALTGALLDHLGLANPQDLIGWAYTDTAWSRFAALAPLAVACAAQGDAVAQRILVDAAAALAGSAAAVVEGLQLAGEAFPFVLTGGNLQPGLLHDALAAHLAAIAPHATIGRPLVEPAVGAALLASRHIARQLSAGEMAEVATWSTSGTRSSCVATNCRSMTRIGRPVQDDSGRLVSVPGQMPPEAWVSQN